ncbi:MAG: 6-bladed beta-propeller [Bacteroidales bacterium]|nr:6-bladed beta-propeller [Bacteroidales bacterium]
MKKNNLFRSILFMLLLSLILPGCNSDPKPSGDLIYIDVCEGFKNKRNIKLSELVESVEFVQFENTKDTYFMNARSFSIGQKYIMISDDGENRIILFDRSGKFIRHIGRRGKGPGEFNNPWQVAMDPSEEFIFIADGMIQKLIKYKTSGEFVDEISTRDLAHGRFMDDIRFVNDHEFVVQLRRPYKEVEGFASLLMYDTDLNLTKKVLTRPSDQVMPRIRSMINQGTDRFYFWEAYMDTMYTITPDGEAIPTHIVTCSNDGPSLEYAQSTPNPRNEGPASPENLIMSVNEYGSFMFMYGLRGDGRFNVVYDKKTGEIFELQAITACDTSGTFTTQTIENDLYGVDPIYINRYDPGIGMLIGWVRTSWLGSNYDLDCIRNKKVKYPELRDQLLRIAEDEEASENMLLVLMKMK